MKRKADPVDPKRAQKRQRLQAAREQLPIFKRAQDIRAALQEHRVLVLSGETGSGKSTQVPQFLLDSKWCTGKIAITQPRRVAAISLARRVAEEMGSPLGSSSPASKVGYSVRFDDNTSPSTKIKYLTEGMLLQELLRDEQLSQYNCVVVDEVHERSVNVDLLLGFLKGLLYGKRNDSLRVVVMSATADVEGISKFFSEPPKSANVLENKGTAISKPDFVRVSTCHVEGRQYPVKVHYMDQPTNDVIDAALQQIFTLHIKEALPGDVLVFLTGQESIQNLHKLIEELAAKLPKDVPKIQVLPLYAALSQEAQQRIFERAPRFTRKVILSTNIAETSVTVPGVHFVIDTGKAKMKQFRHQLGLESLLVKPISKSSADQRKGRAGREAPGHCYRLYPKLAYDELEQETIPEILRCDLSAALLAIKAREGSSTDKSSPIADILHFPFLTRPSDAALSKALLQLLRLSALDMKTSRITPQGRQIARLPLPPRLGRVLVEAARPHYDVLLEVIDIAACLSVEDIFLRIDSEDDRQRAEEAQSQLFRRAGDHLRLLAAVRSYASETSDRKRWCKDHMISHRAMKSVMDVRKQLTAQCKSLLSSPPSTLSSSVSSRVPTVRESIDEEIQERIIKCFAAGFRQNIARGLGNGQYRTLIGNHEISIHPGSVLFGRKVEAILYNEFVYTTKRFARGVSVFQLEWLERAGEEQAEREMTDAPGDESTA